MPVPPRASGRLLNIRARLSAPCAIKYTATMPKSLYVIDGHAQIYRAYYAPFGSLTSPSGEPTRATHVFSQMLLNMLRDKKPDYLLVTLDADESQVFRRTIDPEYKAHREPAPEDFPIQERRIIEILQAARVPLLALAGYEADDVMATLANRLAGPDLHVYLVSKDKDLDQVLGEHVSLYDPGKDEIITPGRLFEAKGWTPAQAIDAQTLIGDSVDNVRGVEGIGPKTAAKLLQKYGSAAAVVAHADELTPKLRDNVRAFASRLELTRQLVTLVRDVPIEFDLGTAEITRFDWNAAAAIFRQLGFRRLTEQAEAVAGASPGEADTNAAAEVPAEPKTAGAPRRPAPAAKKPARVTQGSFLFDPPPGAGSAAEPDSAAAATNPAAPDSPPSASGSSGVTNEMADASDSGEPGPDVSRGSALARMHIPAEFADGLSMPDGGEYKLINSAEEFDALIARLAEQPEFAVDTETTGTNPIDAELVGVALAWEVGCGYYVPTRSVFGAVLPLELLQQRLGPLLADPRRRKIGHNIKYDLQILSRHGLAVAGPLFDTMIAAFALDPTRTSYGMDALVHALLRHRMIPITDLIGRGRDQIRLDQAPLEHVAEYSAEDADYTWRMKQLFEPHLAAAGVERLFYDTEMPLVRVLTAMESNGIAIDSGFLREVGGRLQQRTAAIVDEVHALVQTPFNLDSPKQLADVLFNKLQLRVVRRTKTGPSTDAETLETLYGETQHPVLRLILEYRELQKLLGTYIEALPTYLSRNTGRVHTSYHQTGAVTGRLSSSEPNLQNIPIRTELGRQIRKAFVPRGPDERLVVADYSQIELRILAHYCGDENLIQAFHDDRDIHAVVAAQVNSVPLDAVTKDMRSRAKAVNFGIIYGQSAFGLAQTTGMSRNEAQAFIDQYFVRYPRIREFIQQCVEIARREGCVRTILGRARPIDNIDSRNRTAKAQAERFAVNTVIQGSAADLIKIAMVRLHERIETERLPLRMLLQVHDELVCEAPQGAVESMVAVLRETMSGAAALRVPLKVDVEEGANWLDAK